MTEYLRMLWEPIAKLPRGQKIALGAMIALVIGLILAVTMWGSQKEYTPLFEEQLKMEDAGKVTAKLKELNVDYRLGKTSTDVLVPITDKSYILLQLAQEKSLPQARPGWGKLIDERSIFAGTTQQEFDLNYIRGLQDELESGLVKFGPVENAKVYITKPKKETFKEDQKEPTAAVFLKLKPNNNEITKDQIRAIRDWISTAVEGLKPENVRINDDSARDLTRLLTEDEEMSLDKAKTAQNKHTIEMEKRLEKKLQSQLEEMFGTGKAVVRVTAVLDFDQKEAVSDVVIPPVEGATQGVAISEKVETEQYEGQDMVQDGEPGVNSNLPPGAPSYPGNENKTNNKYGRSANIRNYDFTHSKEKFIKEQGTIKRLSVSVVLDFDQAKLGANGEEQLRSSCQATIGYNKKRGDVFQLMVLPFNNDMADRARRDMDERKTQERNMFMIVVGLMMSIPVLLGLVYIFVRVNRARAIAREKSALEQAVAEEEALRKAEELRRQKSQDQQQEEWEQRFKDINNFFPSITDLEEKRKKVQGMRLEAYRYALGHERLPPDFEEMTPEEQYLFREAFQRKEDGALEDGIDRLSIIMGERERLRQEELEREELARQEEAERQLEEMKRQEMERSEDEQRRKGEAKKRASLEEQVREMVATNTKDAVQVLKLWLEE
ncbi:MAG: flagellar M-ring protein FliF [Candidatus Riflebacteria bacterium]|nr:flagellar M-ring protein FliF [Candidatus Riflebacteria bacterium]